MNNFLFYISTFLTGYLLGSIPTAYIILKTTHKIDITQHGSGNVGAMNSFKVTKSKKVAIFIFLLDALKGWLSVYLAYKFISSDFISPALALTAAAIGHCFSIWLKFRGGRGLATLAGGALFISVPSLIIWAIIWLIAFAIKHNIHFGNIIASLLLILFSISFPDPLIKYSYLQPTVSIYFTLFIAVNMMVILFKHSDSIKELIKNR